MDEEVNDFCDQDKKKKRRSRVFKKSSKPNVLENSKGDLTLPERGYAHLTTLKAHRHRDTNSLAFGSTILHTAYL